MSKRGENIRKRKDGRWEARLVTADGKQKSIYAESYIAVKEKLKNPTTEKAQKETKEICQQQEISFTELCQNWIKTSEIKNKQSTTARYKNIIQKHINPYFQKINTSQITPNHINTFIRQKNYQEKLKSNTINTITAVLIQIIKYGEKQGYIQKFSYDITKPANAKKELQILTPKEQEKLVNHIKTNITHENIGILLSLYAGLRIGEICALQWKDIDTNTGTISITKTMQRIQTEKQETGEKTKIITDAPKSQKSVRTIPIPEFLRTELETLSKNRKTSDYLLTANSQYAEPRNYQYKFKKYLEQAGIRNINFHALRHTFATRAVEQNIDVKTLSEILGHATVNFTLDRYVHPSFNLKKQNIEKLAVCY